MKFFILTMVFLVTNTALAGIMAKRNHHHAPPKKVAALEPSPGARCDQIRQSVLTDLPRFCGEEANDQIRLIDFGNQIDLLEKQCGQPALAAKLKKALGEKVHRKSKAACISTAEEMSRDGSVKATASSASDAGF